MEAVTDVSPQAEQLISDYQLGQVRGVYKGNFFWKGLIQLAALPFGILFLALGWFVLPTSLPPFSGDWFFLLEQWSPVLNMLPLLLFGSGLLLMGITGTVLFLVTLWRGEQQVYLGEKGFLSVYRQVETAVRWETVREIRRRVGSLKEKSGRVQQISLYTVYTILPVEGKACSLADEPGPVIEEAVTAALLPRAVEEYEAGQSLSFGWLALDRQGLRVTADRASEQQTSPPMKSPGRVRKLRKIRGTSVTSGEQVLPWTELEFCWIDESRGTLVISKKEERQHWAILPLSEVPNVALCCKLVEHAQARGRFAGEYI